jgi:hypothetical protein
MQETVGSVSTCGRELLRGWWRPIGLMVSLIFYSVAKARSQNFTFSPLLRQARYAAARWVY